MWKKNEYNYFENVAYGKWREYHKGRKHHEFTEMKRFKNDDGLVVELSRVYKMYLKLTPSAAYKAESINFGGPFINGSWTYDIFKSKRSLNLN